MCWREVALFCDFTVLGTSVERSKQAYPCSLTATIKYHRLCIIIFIWSSLFSIKKISPFFLFSFLSCIFRTWVCRSMFSTKERRRKKEVSMHGVTHSWPVYVNTQALAHTKLRSCVKVEVAVPSWAPQGVPNTSLLLIVLMVSVDVQQIQLEPTHTNLN